MHVNGSSVVVKPVSRLVVAILLASAATGCSSDSSRFGGLFNRSDLLTTSSVNTAPVPQSDVGQGGMDMGRNQALAQPMPPQPTRSAELAPAPVSRARAASQPIAVQRTELAEPGAAAVRPKPAAPREVASLSRGSKPALAEPVSTGSTPAPAGSKNGWSTTNAPAVMLRQGESVATLSQRYGVPEKEILKANGLTSAAQAEPGQRIVIPTFGVSGSAAKASASSQAASLDIDKQKNKPELPAQREVAILPGQSQSREKGGGAKDLSVGKQPETGAGDKKGAYVVKPGDSLNRIAKQNGVSVDELRAANGMANGTIRVGQELKLPAKSDQVMTASVKPAATPPVVAEAQPKKPAAVAAPAAEKEVAEKPAAPKQSVTEVASRDDGSADAPKATGISKYRWPVRGAVIAGYGANVNGNRNDGINISVPEGTPIKAAENGVVIYSGSSLKELGNAVLIRHDDGTVTVYGNAANLNVQRGQKIQRGQTIASSGMSGTATQPQVHFEVRKSATPVNPSSYLE
ncbi:peptidoglycan-binding protein [Xaviernesmea oryzae]|uniref:Peptidoglycan-binding protein n=1 Tax=Xaviernesmea oryzae TaxID=464029 RepID=A0A1Q9AX34_9HYPH|nr:peptidoglycan DD-metalloendopeptidase family protein [Xaviernesmea oryzae]OLP59991.1 peptidoglycan-binding protein [Xaviernesmea oryzae]SEK41417.1 Murein DD-endopeptidase MepM and murein hydrolase activator NlpD, contain LysM domain [Xaviernesmea oryzae]